MAYIYRIWNDINNKNYIGKTLNTIEQRWGEHCREYKRQRSEKRPLYNAMRKYGIEHFHIEQIEQCSPDILNERETFWIEYYGTFKNGYNATKGGDGKPYLDYELIVATYKETQNITQTAELTGAHIESIHNILTSYNIPIKSGGEVTKAKIGKPVAMLDKNTEEVLKVFSDQSDAAKWLQNNHKTTDKRSKNISSHISQAARGKRKTAYGYKWKHLLLLYVQGAHSTHDGIG